MNRPPLAVAIRFSVALALVSACGEDAPDSGGDELARFWDELRAEADAFAYAQGQWEDDYSDGAFYGMAFYARAGVELTDEAYIERAHEIRDYNVSVLEHAIDDLPWYNDNLEEVLYSALGLIEYAGATGDAEFIETLDAYLDLSNLIVANFDDYVDASIGAYAADTYGPTSITGGLALLNLQYAKYLQTDRRQDRIDRAIEIVQAIDANAFDGQRYRFRPGDDWLELYPNSIMILVLCRLYELTGEVAWRDRAEQVFQGIEPLRNTEHGYYRSPYSAEYMGAQTDDYSTLSSQNYLTLALLLLHQATGEDLYLDRAEQILEWIRTTLYDPAQGRILHHWIDGHIAQPTDPEYFCSGCNLQYLYVVWYLRSM